MNPYLLTPAVVNLPSAYTSVDAVTSLVQWRTAQSQHIRPVSGFLELRSPKQALTMFYTPLFVCGAAAVSAAVFWYIRRVFDFSDVLAAEFDASDWDNWEAGLIDAGIEEFVQFVGEDQVQWVGQGAAGQGQGQELELAQAHEGVRRRAPFRERA